MCDDEIHKAPKEKKGNGLAGWGIKVRQIPII